MYQLTSEKEGEEEFGGGIYRDELVFIKYRFTGCRPLSVAKQSCSRTAPTISCGGLPLSLCFRGKRCQPPPVLFLRGRQAQQLLTVGLSFRLRLSFFLHKGQRPKNSLTRTRKRFLAVAPHSVSISPKVTSTFVHCPSSHFSTLSGVAINRRN